MARSILDLPPEVIVHTLSFLPIQTLLRFSQTCHYSHRLAKSSLHTLSLGIYPSRVSGIISKLAGTQYPQPTEATSAFSPLEQSWASSSTDNRSRRSSIESDLYSEESVENDPYRVSVLIPNAHSYDYMTLLAFHTTLTKSILVRHGNTLRNLDLSLWTLTAHTAKAISSLSALRAVSIRIEDFTHLRAVPRHYMGVQRAEQRDAWGILTKSATWAPRLHALRIEGGELSTAQLAELLGRSRWCRELWLCRCNLIGSELWTFLGSEWRGRAALRLLGVMRCGGQLDVEALDAIGRLGGLQFLTLHGCHGVDSEVVEMMNHDFWRIPEVIPPLSKLAPDGSTIIEVDPAYLTGD